MNAQHLSLRQAATFGSVTVFELTHRMPP